MTRSHSTLLSLSLVTALGSFGCAAPPDPNVTGALTTGRVTSDEGASAGVAVRAYGVAPDGTMTPASDTSTTTADGRYSLRVTLDDAATRLVVRVQDGTDRMTSLGRASLGAVESTDTHIVLAPIDARSRIATNVDVALEATTDVPLEQSASSSLFLSPNASMVLAAAADQPATIAVTARAMANARATFVQALDPSVAGSGDVQTALASVAIEEATLAARLDTAATAADVDAAYAAYLDASIAALFDAGYSRSAIAAASLSMESALDLGIGSRMSEGRAELRELGAFAVTSAVDEGVGASFESTAVVAASATLRTTVVAMSSAESTSAGMADAWGVYGGVVESELSARAGLVSTLVDTLAVDVLAATVTLEATWSESATASASARVQAYSDYRLSIETTEHVDMLTLGGVDAEQAHMILTSMADISAATH
jgi:hypothetical protein